MKNLILDLDNTLYGYDEPHQFSLKLLLDSFSKKFEISKDQTQQSFDRARKNTHLQLPARAASHNRLLYIQKMLEYNGINAMQHALDFYELYWGTFLEQMKPFPKVITYLEKQRALGSKVCILTDLTAHIQYRKIQKLGLTPYIDFLVTSEEVGVEKPHPSMFNNALAKLACAPTEALMIGDSYVKDIIGANALGISGIWINHKKENKPELKGLTTVFQFEDILAHGK